jgi:hypothetical protein
MFGDIDPASCPDVIEYGGEDGKPFYVAGPYDDVDRVMNQLTLKLGPHGFHFIVAVPFRKYGLPGFIHNRDDGPEESTSMVTIVHE